MVEVIGSYAGNQRDIVRHGSNVRQKVGDVETALAVTFELAMRAEQLRRILHERVHEREALAFQQRLRGGLAVVLLQFRFVIEEFQLARPAGHEEINDALHFRGKVRRLGRGGIQRLRIRASQAVGKH